MYLNWSDVNFELRTVRVTAKPNLREYTRSGGKIARFQHQWNSSKNLGSFTVSPELPICVPIPYREPQTAHAGSLRKAIALRAKLDPTKLNMKTFRSTYATGMLRPQGLQYTDQV